ncbi:hypothetical protein NO1_1643 [Candidatus Termititenax aidoneus]|uniref:Uncharacterized protein n=1 Tax=Termititenax aidoneus TaxID=2218524 RepID=A0A388TCA6_TERA1|nr:hypothetical protein NO1_1643 [Candidatus Termititenax aidoneus]
MSAIDDFEDQPENEQNAETQSYLARYYNEALAEFLQSAAPRSTEVYPYEVLIFSEQPGVLRKK